VKQEKIGNILAWLLHIAIAWQQTVAKTFDIGDEVEVEI
jgi:hypothetical protein